MLKTRALIFVLMIILATCISAGAFTYVPLVIMIIGAIAAIRLLRRVWEAERARDIQKKEAVDADIQRLEERLLNRETTLKNLEKQVADIIDLFEVAKHFNQCLTIDDVVDILRTKVLDHLFANASTLILLDPVSPTSGDYTAYRIKADRSLSVIDAVNGSDDERAGIDSYIKTCFIHKEVIRIDYPIQFNDYFDGDPRGATYPLWLFPLVVENKMIAIYVVTGAHMNDFSKFAIIAAQLALQIKKIRLYEDVKELSITDGLTKVFLRRHFLERFEGELKRTIKYGLPLCVLMLDIDHFKEYNDNYGHLVGDVTLKEVAQVIKDNVRKVDLIGRYGGEEFIIVLPETNKEGGIDAAERIRSAMARKRLKVYDEETKITVSIGIAAHPEDNGALYTSFEPVIMETLIKKADECLYRAKEEGRNRIVHT